VVAPERTILEPFFLEARPGRRFCVYRGPAAGARCRGGIVHVPAFGEEMHKSRRMVAEQARRFAERGFASVQIDLHGCGDSDGDFADARWETWERDVAAAAAWLEERTGGPVRLWGLRLGATLAAKIAADRLVDAAGLVLWQPVANGATFLNQFLRLKVAGGMVAGARGGTDTKSLRGELLAGGCLEIAGYTLAPELASALDGLSLGSLVPAPIPCAWLDVSSGVQEAAGVSPASAQVIEAWRRGGTTVDAKAVPGEPFWASVEIAECPALIDATLAACDSTT